MAHLSAAGLSFRYRAPAGAPAAPRAAALSGIDLRLDPGTLTGVMGPTGAGKSTLVRTLHRAIPAFFPGELSGDVRLSGASLAGRSVADLAGEIGVVLQDFEYQLFSTNCALEVAFGPRQLGVPPEEARRRVADCLRACGLAGFEGREPGALSGGEKQRLAIAAVLAMRPGVMLLDEPTTDLDPPGKRALYRLLDDLRRAGRALLVVDVESEEMARADRLLLLAGGRALAYGTPGEILTDLPLLQRAAVRPPQMVEVLAGLGLEPRLLPPEECADAIRRAGIAPAPDGVPLPDGARSPENGGPPAAPPLLAAEGVSFAYPDGEPVVHDVDLTIGRGEFVAILGANGSGKTTLAKVLAGLLRPGSGRVLLEGGPLASRRPADVARRIGYIFQNPDHQIAAATVGEEVAFALENFACPRREVAGRVAGALAVTGLEGREAEDPYVLTKGERQRVALASVLAYSPEAIIMDEPTTGLDEREQQRVLALLRRLNAAGRTVVIITHALAAAAGHARRAIVMEAGRVAADGPIDRVLGDAGVLCRVGLPPLPVVRLGALFGATTIAPARFLARCGRRAGG